MFESPRKCVSLKLLQVEGDSDLFNCVGGDTGEECVWSQDVCTWGCGQGASTKAHSKGQFPGDIWQSQI
jgi:hypothetical protein